MSGEWQPFDYVGVPGLIRDLPDGRQVAVVPMLFTWALIVGQDVALVGHEDRWCYATLGAAVLAGSVWDGLGEPVGWHRHPSSGRRRPDGDPAREHAAP